MSGTLYLVATPIGNLGDFSPRAAETLGAVDFIAAEDTRVSVKLLNHFQIKKPLVSYHEHNHAAAGQAILQRLLAGESCALVTDAGTPAISDPGEVLVKMCQEAGITVTSLPGPAACITALTLSGLSTRRFCFEGFLPFDNKKELRAVLEEMKEETRTIILYEAPHHLIRTLKSLEEALGDRRVTLCRELTKKFETVFPTTLREALAFYETREPRGEYVLVIEGRSRKEKEQEQQAAFAEMSMEEHMELYENQGLDRKEAMKRVAKDRGISRREVYQYFLERRG